MPKRPEEVDSRRVMIMGDGGVVSPIGNDVPTFFKSLIAGQSGIGFLPEEMRTPRGVVSAAFVKNYQSSQFLRPRDLADIHPAVQFANTVKNQALESAGLLNEDLTLKDVEPKRIGIVMGTGIGGTFHIGNMQNALHEGRHINGHDLFLVIPCRTALVLTMQQQNIQGPAVSVNDACASSAAAVILAAEMVKSGRVDVVVTGGAESCINKLTIAAFDALGALSPRPLPDRACRPFDKEASGFVLGEGAGALVLESLASVRRRKAEHLVRGELFGYMHLSDGFCEDTQEDNIAMGLGAKYRRNPNVAPTLTGAVNVMRGAIENAGLFPEDIDYTVTHGPGTNIGGIVESTAKERTFGRRRIPITAGKEYAGHMIAGDIARFNGAMMSLRTGDVPQILNLENPVSDLDFVMGRARHYQQGELKTFIFNQFGFGGANVSLVAGLVDGNSL